MNSGSVSKPGKALAVVGALILEAGTVFPSLKLTAEIKILLAQRPPGKRLAGLWEFPGGKIESGETPEQALKRELQEELQLDVRVIADLGLHPHVYEWGRIDLRILVVEALSEPRLTPDVQGFRWFKPHEIDLKTLAPADHAPFAAFMKNLS